MTFNPRFEPAISSARFATYRAVATDDDHAWSLYRWNLDLAAGLVPLGCDVEVALRNTIHHQLTTRYQREDWWACSELVLDDETSRNLANVVRTHKKRLANGTIGPGKIIADLTLGTWVMLLSRGGTSALGRSIDYESNIWRPVLRLGFATGLLTPTGRPRRPTRDDVHLRASNLQQLRNRSAHHEPIFNGIRQSGTQKMVPLLTVWKQTLELLRWMNPDLATVHEVNPVIPDLLTARR